MSKEEELKKECLEIMGNYLKMKRIERSKTQEEIGVNVGYGVHTAKQSISQLERGLAWIPNKKQNDFIRVLQIDPDFLNLANYHFTSRNYADAHQLLKTRISHELEMKKKQEDTFLKGNPVSNAPGNESAERSVEEKLQKLKALFEKGLIDEDDYKEAKRDALKNFLT